MYSTCNEIVRRVGITTAAMKKLTIINYDSLCSYFCLTYPVYKAHAPNYVVICDLTLPHFSILSHTHHNFRKYIENKGVFFSTTSSEIFLIIRRTERYIIRHAHKSARYTCHVLTKLQFYCQIKKKSNTKYHENPFCGNRVSS